MVEAAGRRVLAVGAKQVQIVLAFERRERL
jgi:hypothetical protein